MKSIKFLTVLIGLVLFSSAAFAEMPSVEIKNNGSSPIFLTYETIAPQVCRDELATSIGKSCPPEGCFLPNDVTLKFDKCQVMPLTFQQNPGVTCQNSQAEVALYPIGTNTYFDISLVNGFTVPIKIGSKDTGTVFIQTGAWPGANQPGVYPYGCSDCTKRVKPEDCGMQQYGPTQYCSQTPICDGHVSSTTNNYIIQFG